MTLRAEGGGGSAEVDDTLGRHEPRRAPPYTQGDDAAAS
jgi:hypothetical protein